jgi:hypothetical protein
MSFRAPPPPCGFGFIGASQGKIDALDEQFRVQAFERGFANHVASVRFSQQDLTELCGILNTPPISTLRLVAQDPVSVSPRVPPHHIQCSFLDIEANFAMPAAQSPWWSRYVCANRDRFVSTALGIDVDGSGLLEVVYILLFAKQSPYKAVFCRRRGVPPNQLRMTSLSARVAVTTSTPL